jgi:hypothetical protein
VAAFGLCKDGLEKMRGTEYSNIATGYLAAESVRLGRLGGSECVPLPADRSCLVTELPNPERKVVTVSVDWTYKGRAFGETVSGVIYRKQ